MCSRHEIYTIGPSKNPPVNPCEMFLNPYYLSYADHSPQNLTMKKAISVILTVATLSSCSPKIGSKIKNHRPPLPDSVFVLVLQETDTFMNDGIEIGTISSGDKGFSTRCTYYEVIGHLKKLARENGANLIKIVKRKDADNWSTCVRLKAKAYQVPDFRKHEKQIQWSEERKLTWNDFKGTPKTGTDVAAETACEFGFEYYRLSIFHKAKFVMRSAFNCELSWVRPDQKRRTELLQHEQSHFDLCELYTRKLRQKLQDSKMTAAKLKRESSGIFQEIYHAYQLRQQQYDHETDFSKDLEKEAEWSATIHSELSQLAAYTSH